MEIGSVPRRQSRFSEEQGPRRSQWVPMLLLACGLLAAVVSCATDLTAAATRYAYDFASQSTSVLTAPGAPSRPVVVALQLAADGLVIAFAFGLWLSPDRRRSLMVLGGLLVVSAVLQAIAVVFFPFNPDRPTSDFTNSVNVALMAPSIVGWFLAIAAGAFVRPTWFRFFSVALLLAFLAADLMATAGASLLVPGGRSGSLVGLQERAMGYGFWTWVAVLAAVQLRLRVSNRARTATRLSHAR